MKIRKLITVNIQVNNQNFESKDQQINYQIQDIPEVNAYLAEGFDIERMYHTSPNNPGDCLNFTFLLAKTAGDSEQKRKTKMKF